MPFFLPRRLIELQYLGSDEKDEYYDELASPYKYEQELAFFIVNFGFSKKDFDELTPKEIAFIHKAYENKVVFETSLINKAVLNAIYNTNRGKKRFKALWEKKPQRTDPTLKAIAFSDIQQAEKKKGFDWIKKIKERKK